MKQRASLLVLLFLAVALAGAAHLRTPPAGAPPRVPRHAVEPWMADALPGVGPARRAAATEAIRNRQDAQLPAAARPVAETVFSE